MNEWILTHLPETVLLIGLAGTTLIQVAPIRVNPWSALAEWIGRAINKEMMDNVSSMQETLDKHITKDDERYAKQCRLRILRFNDEILQQKRHTKEHFDEILDDITEYERYCAEHPDYKNNKAVMAIHNVNRVYGECLARNSFL